jgi:hypothetical protein
MSNIPTIRLQLTSIRISIPSNQVDCKSGFPWSINWSKPCQTEPISYISIRQMNLRNISPIEVSYHLIERCHNLIDSDQSNRNSTFFHRVLITQNTISKAIAKWIISIHAICRRFSLSLTDCELYLSFNSHRALVWEACWGELIPNSPTSALHKRKFCTGL